MRILAAFWWMDGKRPGSEHVTETFDTRGVACLGQMRVCAVGKVGVGREFQIPRLRSEWARKGAVGVAGAREGEGTSPPS